MIPEVGYEFSPADYDAKMGTTTSTDSSVVIPESFEYNNTLYKVTSIAPEAFKGKSTLTSVTINANLAAIGDNAFANTNLSKVYYYGTTVPSCSGNVFYGSSVISVNITDSYESNLFCGKMAK